MSSYSARIKTKRCQKLGFFLPNVIAASPDELASMVILRRQLVCMTTVENLTDWKLDTLQKLLTILVGYVLFMLLHFYSSGPS